MKLWIILLLLIICSNISAQIDMEMEKDKIKTILVDMWDAVEKEDIERYASYIHPDYTAFGEYGNQLDIGKNKEIDGVKSWLKNSSDIKTQMHNAIVNIEGNIAWITYIWTDSGIDAGKAFNSKGKSTRIFKKENESWLCIHSHFTLLENK